MGTNQSQGIQYLHEAALSVNLAFALVAFAFLLDPRPVTSALFRMDRAIYRHLHLLPPGVRVMKDTYTGGYFAFFIPAIALAVCSWLLLRTLSRTGLIRELLRSVAGIAALAMPPTWWLFDAYAAERRYGWTPLAASQFYEVLLVLALATLYLFRNRPNSEWAVITVVVLHYGFWFWQSGPHPFFMGYGGPVAPATGLCAGLAWVLYLRHLRVCRVSLD